LARAERGEYKSAGEVRDKSYLHQSPEGQIDFCGQQSRIGSAKHFQNWSFVLTNRLKMKEYRLAIKLPGRKEIEAGVLSDSAKGT
jgi:hypothetical protein